MERIRSTNPSSRGVCNNVCAFCYENRTRRANHKNHKWYQRIPVPFVVTPWEYTIMQKPDTRNGTIGGDKPLTGAFMADFPLTWSYLTDDKWDDGTRRQRATLLIIADGGTVKVWMGDKACQRSAWVTGESLEQAFTILEEQLGTNAVAWRPMAPDQQKRGRRG